MDICPICYQAAHNPLRWRNTYHDVILGCIHPFHDGYPDAWHMRLSAQSFRAKKLPLRNLGWFT
jgi:hypothetical protein